MFRLARTLLIILTTAFAYSAGAQIAAERPVSTPVFTPVTPVFSAAVASDGDQFLAAWIDAAGVHASRIDHSGTVLDPAGIFLGPGYSSASVGVAWDAEAYVIIWLGPNGSIAARVAPDGRIVDQQRVIFQTGLTASPNVVVAANRNVSVMATAFGYVVLDHELRVMITGSLSSHTSVFRTGADEFTVLTNSRAQRLDAFGRSITNAVVNGFEGDSISCHGIDCIRVSSSATTKHLTVAQYDSIALTSGAPIDLVMTQRPFALVATANGYVLATSDGSIQRLDLAGRPIGTPTTPCCVPSGAIAAASNGREVIVLRQSRLALTYAWITSSSEGAPRNLAVSANGQRSPAIAKSATNYLVAWTENDGVYAGRLSFDGSILDGRGKRLVATVSSVFFPPPLSTSVTFDGASYLVAISTSFDPGYGLQRSGAITTVRIDPATGATFAMNNALCGTDMRIASNGSSTVAAWIDCAGGVDVAFLDVNGALASIPVTLEIPRGSRKAVAHPSLAWNGNEWLITWEDQFEWTINDPFQYPDHVTSIAVRGARLSSALTPIDTEPITITNRDDFVDSSRVASDGHDFLAVWSGNNTIHARSITASGNPADDLRVAAGQLQDITWDGMAYQMAFASARNPYDAPANLGLLRLRSKGQPIESLAISNTPDDERSAALVSPGDGHVLAAYTRVENGTERVFIAMPHLSRVRSSRTETP